MKSKKVLEIIKGSKKNWDFRPDWQNSCSVYVLQAFWLLVPEWNLIQVERLEPCQNFVSPRAFYQMLALSKNPLSNRMPPWCQEKNNTFSLFYLLDVSVGEFFSLFWSLCFSLTISFNVCSTLQATWSCLDGSPIAQCSICQPAPLTDNTTSCLTASKYVLSVKLHCLASNCITVSF